MGEGLPEGLFLSISRHTKFHPLLWLVLLDLLRYLSPPPCRGLAEYVIQKALAAPWSLTCRVGALTQPHTPGKMVCKPYLPYSSSLQHPLI